PRWMEPQHNHSLRHSGAAWGADPGIHIPEDSVHGFRMCRPAAPGMTARIKMLSSRRSGSGTSDDASGLQIVMPDHESERFVGVYALDSWKLQPDRGPHDG